MTYQDLIKQAIDQRQSSQVIDRLIDLAGEEDKRRQEFVTSLIKAREAFPSIVRDLNAGGRYKYADLAQISDKVDPHLEKAGITYRFGIRSGDGRASVRCILMHKNGYEQAGDWLEADADTSGNKAPIQALGSSLTYLERYALVGALGLAVSRDDDAASSKPIAQSQLKQITEVLGDQAKAFCDHFELDSLAEIPAVQFDAALSKARAWMKRKEKAA